MGTYDDKWVRELEVDNERMRAAVNAALATVTPENVRLGHTWLRRKMKEAMDEFWRVNG